MRTVNTTRTEYKDLDEVLAIKKNLLSEGYIEIPKKLDEVFRLSSPDGSIKYSAIDTLDFRTDCSRIFIVRRYLITTGANAPVPKCVRRRKL